MPSLGLRRYQVFLGYGVAFLSAWYYALSKREEIRSELTGKDVGWDENSAGWALLAVEWAPLLAALAVALYLLALLVVGVMSFEDCPGAAAQLGRDVREAKDALRRMGLLDDDDDDDD
jgi:hypothetical protein